MDYGIGRLEPVDCGKLILTVLFLREKRINIRLQNTAELKPRSRPGVDFLCVNEVSGKANKHWTHRKRNSLLEDGIQIDSVLHEADGFLVVA